MLGEAEDAEVEAMAVVGQTLGKLDRDAAGRVAQWAAARYGSQDSGSQRAGTASKPNHPMRESFGDVADLYHAAKPKTQGEKVLVVGYWFQETMGKGDLDAQQINTELKQLGHGIGNVTMAFEELIGRKPQLAIQTRKSGSTRQARKKYRLTGEGILRVKSMLTGDQADGE